jgi:acylphosphatase
MLTLRATVYGDVQGVGFRMFVRDAARRRGLKGHVRNLSGGEVFVLASGGRGALEELLVLLRRGPAAAHVEGVEHSWSHGEPNDAGELFEVRH